LGSPANEELLNTLKPKWWFAAHLHVKFKATFYHNTNFGTRSNIPSSTILNEDQTHQYQPTSISTFIPSQVVKGDLLHQNYLKKDKSKSSEQTNKQTSSVKQHTSFLGLESPATTTCDGINDLTDLMTKFLALDKALPRRHYLQIINMPTEEERKEEEDSSNNDTNSSIHYDLEWLAILQKTHNWTNKYKTQTSDPDTSSVLVSEEDITNIRKQLKRQRHNDDCFNVKNTTDDVDETIIPNNFAITVQPYGSVGSDSSNSNTRSIIKMIGNPQTDNILSLLGLDHIITIPYVFTTRVESKNDSLFLDQYIKEKKNLEMMHLGVGTIECNLQQTNYQQISCHSESNEIVLEDNNILNHDAKSNTLQNDVNEIDLDSESDKNCNEGEGIDSNELDLECKSEDTKEKQVTKSNEIDLGDNPIVNHDSTNVKLQTDANEIDLDSESESASCQSERNTTCQHDSNELNLQCNSKRSKSDEGKKVISFQSNAIDLENNTIHHDSNINLQADANEIGLDSESD